MALTFFTPIVDIFPAKNAAAGVRCVCVRAATARRCAVESTQGRRDIDANVERFICQVTG